MSKIYQNELDEIIKKNKNSEFQNCFQCSYFPKKISNSILKPYKEIGYCWNVPDIEKLTFRCKYLNKKISQSINPFRTNSCLCFKEEI